MTTADDAQAALLEAELAGKPIALTWREDLAARLMRDCMEARATLAKLEPAQLAAAQLVAKGYRNKEIARLQGISESSVEQYLLAAFRAADVETRSELAAMVARAGLS